MGYCLITGGGADGRYDIELDFGKAQKDAILAALATAINKNALDILQTENELADAAAEEAALFLVIQDLIAKYAAITQGKWTGTAEEAFEIITGLPKKQAELAKLKAKNEPLRYQLRQLKFVRASLRKQAQRFNLFQPIQSKQAWCADLTEDRAAGSYVGTIEVKGEPDLVLIQPGARAWLPTDGLVTGREIMSPWQAYWNAAVLPGWQKWKPTYRWGTLTAIYYAEDTCDISLAAATSTAQRLGINQDDKLTRVPISYMDCNAGAFKVDDRVIVEFVGQDWTAPLVIGFLDAPKSCLFVCMGTYGRVDVGYACKSTSVMDQLFRDTLDARYRLDGGPWTSLRFKTIDDKVANFRAPYPNDGYYRIEDDVLDSSIDLEVVRDTAGTIYAGAPPCVIVQIAPPYAQVSNPAVRVIVEFAAYVGGAPIFNVAINDIGWFGYPARFDRQQKNRTGVALRSPFGGPVGVLDYTLTAT